MLYSLTIVRFLIAHFTPDSLAVPAFLFLVILPRTWILVLTLEGDIRVCRGFWSRQLVVFTKLVSQGILDVDGFGVGVQ